MLQTVKGHKGVGQNNPHTLNSSKVRRALGESAILSVYVIRLYQV